MNTHVTKEELSSLHSNLAQTMVHLADMGWTTTLLTFVSAKANHDLQRYGEWKEDYAAQAEWLQTEYKNAREKLKL